MKPTKKAAWAVLALLCGLLAMLALLLIAVQAADWAKYGYRPAGLKYVLLTGCFGAAMLTFAVLGIRRAGAGRKKQPAPPAAAQQASGMEGPGGKPGQRTYRSAPLLLAAEFGKKLVFLGFLCILAVQLLLAGNPTLFWRIPLPSWLLGWVLPVLPAALLSAFWALYWCRIRIELNQDGLSFFRGKRRYAFCPLDAPLQACAERKSWNGIFLGTSREFILPGRGPLRKILPCWCLNKSDFSALVEDINRLRQDGCLEEKSPRSEVQNPYLLSQNSVFRLPRTELLSRERKRLLAVAAGSLSAGLLLAFLWFFLAYRGPLSGYAVACIVTILFFPSLITVLHAIRYRLFSKKIPERITFTSGSIRVDEQSFSARELKSVAMTPVNCSLAGSQPSFRRRILLQTALEQAEYQLGSVPGAPKELLYGEYGGLLKAMRSWCAERGVPFRENLN